MGRRSLSVVSEQQPQEQIDVMSSTTDDLQQSWTACMSVLQRCQTTLADLESSYAREVLHLRDAVTEDQVDTELLRTEAGDFGDEISTRIAAGLKAQQAKAMSSELPRKSQESVASKMSQSTGMTSNLSDMSRDNFTQTGRNQSRASLSFRDYDAFLARGTPSARQSFSFSPPTTPSQSTFSLSLSSPESSPKKHFPRIRGLSMLRLHRTASIISLDHGCPHCPPAYTQRRAVHKLPCGHRLCADALRDNVRAAMVDKAGTLPNHCGMPIPGRLVEHVTTQSEQSAFLDRVGRWDQVKSNLAPDGRDATENSGQQRPGALSPSNRTTSDESKVDSVNPRIQKELDTVMELPEYKQMHIEQAEVKNRFRLWVEVQRSALEAQHQTLREELKLRHEASLDELLGRHNTAMDEAEDKQVKTEADLRHSHTQEKRDNATALKHMEAYCAGTYSTGEPHMRAITDSDRTELEKTRRARDQMDTRHESAINVLRGEQGRRMRLRAQRQGREAQELGRTQRKEELELERVCSQVSHQFDALVVEKRQRLDARWKLQMAILVKKTETQTGGTTTRSRLSSVDEWQLSGGKIDMEEDAKEDAITPAATADAVEAESETTYKLYLDLGESKALMA